MNPTDYPLWFILLFVFLFGSVFGSFLNVCIHRFPKHDRLKDQLSGIWGRSNCPRCNTEILARDNIPMVGWLLLRGKCRKCRAPISGRYPLVELCNGLLFVLVYMFQLPDGLATEWTAQCCAEPELGPQMVNGPTALSAPVWMHLRYLFHMVLLESLVVATFIDLELEIIPDGCTVPAMVVAFIASTAIGQVFLVPIWFDGTNANLVKAMLPESMSWLAMEFNGVAFAAKHPHWHGFLVSLAGFIAGGGSIWAVRIIGQRVLQREAMGFGDVILMASIGSFIGWQPVITVFFLAALCAMFAVVAGIVVGWKREIPYGPYLSLATLLVILYWEQIWPYAKSYFDLGVGVFVVGIVMCVSLFACLMVLQLFKRMLGIPLYEEETIEGEWTSADSLHHFAGEKIDEQQGQWRRSTWEGSRSGRGLRQNDVWRHGE